MRKNIFRIAIVVGLILLIPLALTLLNGRPEGEGWHWKLGDFIFAFVMLFGTGLAINFAIRKLTSPVYRVLAVAVIVIAFLLVWVEVAVDGVSQALKWLI